MVKNEVGGGANSHGLYGVLKPTIPMHVVLKADTLTTIAQFSHIKWRLRMTHSFLVQQLMLFIHIIITKIFQNFIK